MANSARVTTGNLPRLLQLGIDKILTHYKDTYKGPGSEIFQEAKTEKGFYEAVQLAGMGLATRKNEGAAITYDSVDQNWVYRWPIYTYEKSARVTMEAIADNLYEDLIPLMGKEQAKALAHNKDYQMAAVLNAAFSTAGPDGKALCASDHPIQAGGTSSNTVTLDISEDAIEQMVILVDGFLNPDGLLSDYETMNLVVPKELRFEADRIVNSKYRVASADNDISAINSQSVVKKIIPWKRLTDTDAFFITTNADNGLLVASRQGVTTDSFKDPTTKDIIVSAYERFRTFFADWRCVVGSPGA
jgi:hypothetical protein